MTKARAIDADRLLRMGFAIIVTAAAIALTAQSAALAASPSWQVTKISGRAWINHDDTGWQALRPGAALVPGDRVETGMKGHIVLSRQGDLLTVWSNSRFRLPGLDNLGPAAHIMQTLGTLQFRITARDGEPFRVRTPYLAAASNGTAFTISVDSGGSALRVTEGAIQVISTLNGDSAVLQSGAGAKVASGSDGRMRLNGKAGVAPVERAGDGRTPTPALKPARRDRATPDRPTSGKAEFARHMEDSLYLGAWTKLTAFSPAPEHNAAYRLNLIAGK